MDRKRLRVLAIEAGLLITVIIFVGCAAFRSKGLTSPGHHSQLFESRIVKHVGLGYYIYLPDDYDSDGKPFPFMLFLHGAGERGDDLEKVKMHGPPKLVASGTKLPFVIVSPQCPVGEYWTDKTGELKQLVDTIVKSYNIDTGRMYCTGLSMGGLGTWSLATRYPGLFAAIAPVCGGGSPHMAAKRLKDVPIWVFHGAKDGVVVIERSEEMVDAVRKAGGVVRFTVYPDANHDSWTETYNNPELYEWLLSHEKQ